MVSDKDFQLALAEGDEAGLLCGDLVDHAESSKLVNWLSSVLCQLHQDLESNFNFDDGTEDFKKLADALCCLKLDSFVLFRQARLDILDESLGRPLVQRRIVQQ